jgi:hypothetical protein
LTEAEPDNALAPVDSSLEPKKKEEKQVEEKQRKNMKKYQSIAFLHVGHGATVRLWQEEEQEE